MLDRTSVSVIEVTSLADGQLDPLAGILVAVVAAGASVGFLPPFDHSEARDYWAGVVRPGNVLLIAEVGGQVAGTAQLELAMRRNGRHRAEVNKVLVHPDWQRRGIGRRLMEEIERVARREERTLLHLDTRAGDASNRLYAELGYIEAGRIPNWAMSADGTLHTTVLYYKLLAASC